MPRKKVLGLKKKKEELPAEPTIEVEAFVPPVEELEGLPEVSPVEIKSEVRPGHVDRVDELVIAGRKAKKYFRLDGTSYIEII